MFPASNALSTSSGATISLRVTPFARSEIAALLGVVLAHAGVLALLAALEAPAAAAPATLMVQVITSAPAPVAAPVAPPAPAPRALPVERKAVPRATPEIVARKPAQFSDSAAVAPSQPVVAPSQAVADNRPSAPAASSAPAPLAAAVAETPARFNADYLRNPTPPYPAISRRLGEEGKVVLRVLVTADGRAGQVELATGSGFSRLDQAAQDAVARWKFVAARRGDEAVAAWVLVPIVFSLGA